MNRLLLAGVAGMMVASIAMAQTVDPSIPDMPGMKMPAKLAAKPRAVAKPRAASRPASAKAAIKPSPRADPRHAVAATAPAMPAGHDMSSMPGMAMPEMAPSAGDPYAGRAMPAASDRPMQHDMMSMPGMAGTAASSMPAVGTDLAPGNAPAPAPVEGLAAARYWGVDAMQRANRGLRQEHGGMTYRQVLFNLAEVQVRDGRDGYRWDGEGWIGGDVDRFTLKSEGGGSVGRSVDHAEIQALYTRALDPYWNLQTGVRQDIAPHARSYATIGVEGLAPYWFETEGALFLSDRGDVLARAEAWYDERVTQFFVLQPRVELNLSAQNVPRDRLGAGVTDAEIGLRLRYEKSRQVAPYVGVSWERQFGDTARFSRARGDDTGGFSLVAGVRTWF